MVRTGKQGRTVKDRAGQNKQAKKVREGHDNAGKQGRTVQNIKGEKDSTVQD